MKKISFYLVMFLVSLSFIFVSGCAVQGGSSEVSTINVNGTGKIITEPDSVEIRISISTDGKTNDVQEENAKKTQNVIDELFKLGLDKKEIETQNVNFYPLKNWTQRDGETTTGYRAENTIVVKTNQIEKAGLITDTAVKNGAQNVGNLAFSLSDAEEKLLDKAIEAAVNDAKKQAEVTAKAAGVSITGVKNINVIKNSGGAPIYREELMMGKSETPVMPKDTEYIVTVDVAFIIN